ncbi:hypothetical protein BH11CYA1_BH11CYA1_40060 [soil metagenome]
MPGVVIHLKSKKLLLIVSCLLLYPGTWQVYCLGLEGSASKAVEPTAGQLSLANSLKVIDSLIADGALLAARSKIEFLLARYPEDSAVALRAARLYQKMGLSAFAIMQYEKVRLSQSQLLEPLVALSKLHLENLSTELAVQLARQAVQIYPSSRDARLALVSALLAEQSVKQARVQADALGRNFPNDPDVEHALASVAQAFGENNKALSLLTAAVEARPSEQTWQLELVDLYITNHDFERARAVLAAIAIRDPQSLEALERLAHLNEFYLHDYISARDNYRKIRSILPDSASAQAGLDRCLVKQGDLALNLRNFIRRLFNLPLSPLKDEEGVSEMLTPDTSYGAQ